MRQKHHGILTLLIRDGAAFLASLIIVDEQQATVSARVYEPGLIEKQDFLTAACKDMSGCQTYEVVEATVKAWNNYSFIAN